MHSVQEKVFWTQTYLSRSYFREVCDKFHGQYPDRPKPHNTIVKRCYDRFQETSSVNYEHRDNHHRREDSMNKTVVLASISVDSHRSTHEMAR